MDDHYILSKVSGGSFAQYCMSVLLLDYVHPGVKSSDDQLELVKQLLAVSKPSLSRFFQQVTDVVPTARI